MRYKQIRKEVMPMGEIQLNLKQPEAQIIYNKLRKISKQIELNKKWKKSKNHSTELEDLELKIIGDVMFKLFVELNEKGVKFYD